MDEDFQILPTPKGYATAEQTAQARKLAQILMGGSKQSKALTHPLEVLGNLANTTLGAHQFNKANELDRASDLFDAQQFVEGTRKPPAAAPAEIAPPTARPLSPAGVGPASVRNNNPGAQWPGPVASQFGATGAQDLPGGNKIASFDSPEKGGAAHFALLAQKYSGMPLEAAIEKWSGGNNSTPYTQFVARRAGISPDTPITPELLRGPQGVQLAKAMADWEAGGSYPMTEQQWAQAHSMAFGGGGAVPQGGGDGGEGQALGFAGVPDEGGGDNAMGGIVSALQAPKFGSQPVPGGPVTQTLPAGAQSQSGNMLPSSVVPQRMHMSGEGLVNTLASTRLDPSIKQAALQIYMEQNQPMQLKIPGGTLLIGNDGSQVPISDLHIKEMKSGDSSMPVGVTFPWDPKTNTVSQSIAPMGGSGGPLGTAPPSANAQDPNSIIPSQMRQLGDYSQEQHRRKEFTNEDLKTVHSKLKEASDLGIQAERNTPLLKQLRQMIEDPKLTQSIGSDFSLDYNRVKALFGDKAAERAAALMQAFDKGVSGQIVSDLKTQLQGTGQIRVAEIDLIKKASASRYNTREANRKILDLMIRANEQISGLNEATADYLAKHQDKATTAGLVKHKIEWLKEHPMMTPEEIKDYNKQFDEDKNYPAPPKPGKNAPKAKAATPAVSAWQGGPGDPPLGPGGWTIEGR